MKNIAAALVFFTRLPFWRLKAFNVPAPYYKQVINYWPVAGWLTAAVMAGVLWSAAQILPYSIAVILAILSRLLVTGALHEDGLADFFDGFGGGNTRERTLEIMKDSHIGTYGVVSLIFYFSLFYLLLSNLSLEMACLVILSADPLCKFIASLITLFLPYARNEETSKSKVVYNKMSVRTGVISIILGLFPFILLLKIDFLPAIIFPIFVFAGLILLMKKKIGGYTGDCCGATFLMCELSFYLGIVIILNCLAV
ncbi:MAG: adenosylcobinamide-GDP ribazoletransferase [Dysgonomonas sp.]|jgi:adenosylcobinamide-GDP ribazoletransferase|uniref:adenosylcobinamide-GDP ribazoletransferase n=1 Tax=unclassified Dysgonomonas TaxID=2630389 RepID=UPI0025BC3570|nr:MULTISPECIES: adenosylcobinamide-GDP ribazoletransferase [unclassified Dysgonomonas]MDR2002813.1 adenosylcobinamide-GDP ribazoletransferase [Prevotella sp.]HMM03444.1 adenosylcobinamide-GDP ribazoletransferase [Dysgonomonas sp.]